MNTMMARSPSAAAMPRNGPRSRASTSRFVWAGLQTRASLCPLLITITMLESYRWLVTPTCWHMSSTGQVEHFGRMPVQTCLPKGTSRLLIGTQ